MGAENKLKVIPLGGTGEIGKNLIAFQFNESIVIIDGGVKFPDDELLGIDLVIPDTAFLENNREKIKALFITHGHEDHIGGLPFILPKLQIPVYGTRLTLGLVKEKMKERGSYPQEFFHEIWPGREVVAGDFTAEAFRVTHSIPDAVGYSLLTPVGRVIYTGDFKIDHTPIDGQKMDLLKLAEWGREGVLALICDSTNAERSGVTLSEKVVGTTLRGWFRMAKGKIIMATFASNVHRIQQAVDGAAELGRKVAVVGRSMEQAVGVSRELGYLQLPEEGMLIESGEIGSYPDHRLLILTTGSQGEPMAALTRMATGNHRQVNIRPGDMVIISATPVPGNEKSINRTINYLHQIGAEVVSKDLAQVHVSGHAAQEEIKLMIRLTAPRFLIPHHGEIRHQMAFRKLAVSLGYEEQDVAITQIGSQVVMDSRQMRMGEKVEAGSIYVDGLGIGDVGNIVLRDRQQLAMEGVVVVVAAIAKGGQPRLISEPNITSRGFTFMKEAEELIEEGKKLIVSVLMDKIGDEPYERPDWGGMKSGIREALGQYLWEKTGRRPMVLPIILQF